MTGMGDLLLAVWDTAWLIFDFFFLFYSIDTNDTIRAVIFVVLSLVLISSFYVLCLRVERTEIRLNRYKYN